MREHDDDGQLRDDYEEIFWWLQTLLERTRLRSILGIELQSYEELVGGIKIAVRDIITEHLSGRESSGGNVSYLSRIADFACGGRAIKVFTLNYDTCVERACRSEGIPIVTGFDGPDLHRRRWQPELFRRRSRQAGIHLYKLHGSLTWFGHDSNTYEDLEPTALSRAKTRYDRRPQLVLGPVTKVQTDDPFWWLMHRFHEELKRARTCVVVGFGGRDPHIARRILQEHQYGLDVVEVTPDLGTADRPGIRSDQHGARKGIRMTASEALQGDSIGEAISWTRSVRL